MEKNMPKFLFAMDWDWTGTLRSETEALCSVVDKTLPINFRRELDDMRAVYLAKINARTFNEQDELAWMIKCIGAYIHAGLSKEQIRAALSRVRLRNHFRELCLFCKQNDIPIAIVSFGINQFIEAVLDNHTSLHLIDRIYGAQLLFDQSGTVTKFIKKSVVVPHNKGESVLHFAESYGVPLENVFAVGDSEGDRNLGLLENRVGIVEKHEEATKILPHFSKVFVSDSFLPIIDWLRRRIESKA